MWIPGSMMYVVAALVVLRAWGASEAKADDRRRRGVGRADAPTHRSAGTASGVRAGVAADNRVLALKLTIVAATVFAIVIAIGVLIVTHVDAAQPVLGG